LIVNSSPSVPVTVSFPRRSTMFLSVTARN
jgi:hypothetical protein